MKGHVIEWLYLYSLIIYLIQRIELCIHFNVIKWETKIKIKHALHTTREYDITLDRMRKLSYMVKYRHTLKALHKYIDNWRVFAGEDG